MLQWDDVPVSEINLLYTELNKLMEREDELSGHLENN